MQISEQEQLTQLIGHLSPDQVRQVLAFTRSLVGGATTTLPVDESDHWSPEDIEDLARATMDYANKQIPYDDEPTTEAGA